MSHAIEIFNPEHLKILTEALYISEDLVNEYYLVSEKFWSKNSYDIFTLKHLKINYYPEAPFAHLLIYSNDFKKKSRAGDISTFYKICLNDHRVLRETRGGEKEFLLPFLTYIFTHELVHIARFARYECLPVDEKKDREERIVHELTRNILESHGLKGLKTIINKFRL